MNTSIIRLNPIPLALALFACLPLAACQRSATTPEATARVEQSSDAGTASPPTPPNPPENTAPSSPTPEPTSTPAPTPEPFVRDVARVQNPRIVIEKAQRVLLLYDGDDMVARMRIGLGWAPEGDKEVEGDGRTPEGVYYACSRNDQSRYYLSIGVSYPSLKDAQRGLDAGLIDQDTYDDIESDIASKRRPSWSTPLGGEIMIHGSGSARDWTAGCIALENDDMDVIWKHVPMGTRIEIRP